MNIVFNISEQTLHDAAGIKLPRLNAELDKKTGLFPSSIQDFAAGRSTRVKNVADDMDTNVSSRPAVLLSLCLQSRYGTFQTKGTFDGNSKQPQCSHMNLRIALMPFRGCGFMGRSAVLLRAIQHLGSKVILAMHVNDLCSTRIKRRVPEQPKFVLSRPVESSSASSKLLRMITIFQKSYATEFLFSRELCLRSTFDEEGMF